MSDKSDAEVADLRRRLEDQAQALARLEDDVQALRHDLVEEVRTRRLAVVGDDGYERVVIRAAEAYGSVAVHARTDGLEPTCAELVANDRDGEEAASVLCALSDDGELIASIELVEDAPPGLFLDGVRDA